MKKIKILLCSHQLLVLMSFLFIFSNLQAAPDYNTLVANSSVGPNSPLGIHYVRIFLDAKRYQSNPAQIRNFARSAYSTEFVLKNRYAIVFAYEHVTDDKELFRDISQYQRENFLRMDQGLQNLYGGGRRNSNGWSMPESDEPSTPPANAASAMSRR